MYTDTTYTVSATSLPDGARHLVDPDVYLGQLDQQRAGRQHQQRGRLRRGRRGVPGRRRQQPDQPRQRPSQSRSIVVTASVAGVLDGWIDWNDDAVWEASEQVTWTNVNGTPLPAADLAYGGVKLQAGANTLYFIVPDGLTAFGHHRSRPSPDSASAPTGLLVRRARRCSPPAKPRTAKWKTTRSRSPPSWPIGATPPPAIESGGNAYHLVPATGTSNLYLGTTRPELHAGPRAQPDGLRQPQRRRRRFQHGVVDPGDNPSAFPSRSTTPPESRPACIRGLISTATAFGRTASRSATPCWSATAPPV